MADLSNERPTYRSPRVYRRRIRDAGRGERFPYDAWADGRERIAREGVDWGLADLPNGDVQACGAGSAQYFRSSIYAWTKLWGTTCRTQLRKDDTVIFSIEPLNPQTRAQRDRLYGPYLYDFDTERGYKS